MRKKVISNEWIENGEWFMVNGSWLMEYRSSYVIHEPLTMNYNP